MAQSGLASGPGTVPEIDHVLSAYQPRHTYYPLLKRILQVNKLIS
jgi:hypothetical protein